MNFRAENANSKNSSHLNFRAQNCNFEKSLHLNFRAKNDNFKKIHPIWIFAPKMSILENNLWIFALKSLILGVKIQMILFHLILFHCVFEFVRFLLCIPEIRNVILRSLKMMVIFWFMFNCHHLVLRTVAVNLLFLLETMWANVR